MSTNEKKPRRTFDIETFYTPVRLHQTLEYQSPDLFE